MVLETLSEELLAQAQVEAKAIIARAQEESELIQEETQQQISSYTEKTTKTYEQEKEQADLIARIRAFGEAKKILLRAQQKAIMSLQEELTNELISIPKEQKVLLYKKILAQTKDLIEPKKIFCLEQDKELLEELTKKKVDVMNKAGLVLVDKDTQISIFFEDIIEERINEKNKKIISELEKI